MIAGVAHRRGAAGADPAVAAVVAPRLLLEALLEVFDQFLRRQRCKVLLVDPQGSASSFGSSQPLFQQGPGDVVQLEPLQIGQLGPLEMVGEDLVVEVEIALAFDQDGPGGGVEVVSRNSISPGRALCNVKKGRGLYRDRRGL